MSALGTSFKYIITTILIIFSWFAVYLMNGTNAPYAHLFYFPITAASLFWGMKDGIITAFVAGVVSGPLMPHHVENNVSQPMLYWVSRLGFFVVFGGFLGKLFPLIKHKREQVCFTKE